MKRILSLLASIASTLLMTQAVANPVGIAQSQTPIFVSTAVPPLNMLVMGRDHKLYYEAYNDASDLNGDGVIDVGYKGYLSAAQGGFDYYGYFNSYVCYTYDGNKFVPSSHTDDKTCSGQWSGDYLNYLTTSRMDALRKVLYGGYRATDDAASTVLQAVFIPQDAHTWGKEYQSRAHDGYRISSYAPLSQPVPGYRHLFAVVSLTDGGIPQLRTLTNTSYRIWNWVSKERPVAGDNCDGGACTARGPNNGWSIVPADVLSNLKLEIWKDNYNSPSNKTQMDTLFSSTYTSSTSLCGSSAAGAAPFTKIDSDSNFVNPYTGNGCGQDNYHTRITGTFTPPDSGTYYFSVDGDDAEDFSIDGFATPLAYYYGGHGASNAGGAGTPSSGIYLEANRSYTFTFRHEEGTGDASFHLYWKVPGAGASTLTNANIRVTACPDDATLRESNCTAYGSGHFKPTGILHDYGASDKMYFGLLSGSFQNNMSGGVLRSQLQSFSREYNATTGQFCSSGNNVCDANGNTNGIVATINKFRIIDFNYSDQTYGCGWITTSPMSQSNHCYMWGNPVGEMMYETMRYFAGATSPTSTFDYGSGSSKDKDLGLPRIGTWTRPYRTTTAGSGYPQCAAPVMTVISDINPSYDYKLPGSKWDSSVSGSGNPISMSDLDVSTEADAIWQSEGGGSKSAFIGESNGVSDSAPTAKTISNLSTLRGLSPEEPSKQGTYYSAAVAHFGANHKVGGDKKLMTYSIALASPLPTIKFPVGNTTVTMVPFAKSVSGSGINPTANFQPTDQIVDYYVETIANTDPSCTTNQPSTTKDCDSSVNGGRPYAKFRINYEDVEQGADHDMDAISLYELMVNQDNTLTINMTSEYADGGIDQHMGYVISGTTRDGIYLDVKDKGGADVAYKFDTPDSKWAGECARGGCATLSRLSSSRSFTPSGSASANFLPNPLWYAAKYGMPDRDPSSITGDPDNYFLVTNALTLKDQLAKAFNDIVQKNSAVNTVAIGLPPQSVSDDRYIYRSTFDIEKWTGDLIKESYSGTNNTRTESWRASQHIGSSHNVKMANAAGDGLVDFSVENLGSRTFSGQPLVTALATDPDTSALPGNPDEIPTVAQQRIDFIDGDRSLEGTTFRQRASLLGDIVNSSPVLVGSTQYLSYLADDMEPGATAHYADFQSSNRLCADTPTTGCRSAQVFVGANDGLLHAFDAETGAETFTFVPTAVIPNLNKLTSKQYKGASGGIHQYYVDGSLVVTDAYFGNAWHTVLVGSLGAGGKEVFALDVTTPSNPRLLWEFTSDSAGSLSGTEQDPNRLSELGYTFSKPLVARLHSGQWGVVFGNGYDSANAESGKAVLFVLNLQTGDVIRKLEAQGEAGNNGLSSVKGADNNGDGWLDYVYAGDLQGNLWRFDLHPTGTIARCSGSCSGVADHFEVSYGGHPLYTALRGSGAQQYRQPITAAPSLVRHPTRQGYIVMFGTGRYLTEADKENLDVQTLYGIWDQKTKGESTSEADTVSGTSSLQKQEFTSQQIGDTLATKVLSNHAISWSGEGAKSGWYLDFKVNSSDPNGERVVDDMTARSQVLLLTTRAPDEDPCKAGMEGWAYGINPFTGGATSFSAFDTNNDGVVNELDQLSGGNIASGIRLSASGGIRLTGNKLALTDGSMLGVNFGGESTGRQSWSISPVSEDDADEDEE